MAVRCISLLATLSTFDPFCVRLGAVSLSGQVWLRLIVSRPELLSLGTVSLSGHGWVMLDVDLWLDIAGTRWNQWIFCTLKGGPAPPSCAVQHGGRGARGEHGDYTADEETDTFELDAVAAHAAAEQIEWVGNGQLLITAPKGSPLISGSLGN